ncbi:hypothetical protein IKF15_00215 [Candidatus Saccharibacteria bacterium]|nr:hypothetical protein [Candidatus Saccharibacteria bacterium]
MDMEPNSKASEIIELDNVASPVAISPLEALERANVDIAIATANKYPRDIARVKDDIKSMATLDQETAQACFYTLPPRKGERAGKRIQGPSVRLAEIAVSCYRNIKAAYRIIADDGKFIVAQGVCHDLQQNVSTSVEIRRRITNKEGVRYSDDMIQTTCQAAGAIAYRNAVFKVVPMALVKPAFDAAKKVAVGEMKNLSERRGLMIETFGKMGIEKERVLKAVDRASVEEITLDDLEALIGYYNSIKDGESSVEEIFPVIKEEPKVNMKKLFEKGEKVEEGQVENPKA